MDAFWDRRTNFWNEKKPLRSRFARSKAGSAASRRSRRIRARSRRKLASLCALASLVLLVAFVHGLVASNVGRGPGREQEAGAADGAHADGAHAGGQASGSPQGPGVNALPVALVTDG